MSYNWLTVNNLCSIFWFCGNFFVYLLKFYKNEDNYKSKKCFKAYGCKIYIHEFIYNEFSRKKL